MAIDMYVPAICISRHPADIDEAIGPLLFVFHDAGCNGSMDRTPHLVPAAVSVHQSREGNAAVI